MGPAVLVGAREISLKQTLNFAQQPRPDIKRDIKSFLKRGKNKIFEVVSRVFFPSKSLATLPYKKVELQAGNRRLHSTRPFFISFQIHYNGFISIGAFSTELASETTCTITLPFEGNFIAPYWMRYMQGTVHTFQCKF